MRGERNENDVVFSKVVKAGKRTYFIDVKRDRRNESYIQITESKRMREPGADGRPQYEKHKLFLYREDFDKFQRALNEAAACASEQMANCEYFAPWRSTTDDRYDDDDVVEQAAYEAENDTEGPVDFKLNVVF